MLDIVDCAGANELPSQGGISPPGPTQARVRLMRRGAVCRLTGNQDRVRSGRPSLLFCLGGIGGLHEFIVLTRGLQPPREPKPGT